MCIGAASFDHFERKKDARHTLRVLLLAHALQQLEATLFHTFLYASLQIIPEDVSEAFTNDQTRKRTDSRRRDLAVRRSRVCLSPGCRRSLPGESYPQSVARPDRLLQNNLNYFVVTNVTEQQRTDAH